MGYGTRAFYSEKIRPFPGIIGRGLKVTLRRPPGMTRFCTTCGRNYEESIDICPHDGTPLFGMAGTEDEVEQVEAVAAEGPAFEDGKHELSEPGTDETSDEIGRAH